MASSKPSSSRIASLLALITTFACVFAGIPPPPPVAERTCSVLGEKLTLFNQETAFLFLPCKYRLADFTCGDYRVKVTPGSSVDADNFYSPVSVWVKVVNTVTNDTVKLRTSLGLLERAEAGTIDNAWKIKEGNTSFLDFAGYDGGIARLEKDGVFTVQFSNNSVQVSCVAPDFSSPGVPETLCGDGSTVDEVKLARSALLEDTDLDLEEFLLYIILNDTTVTQRDNRLAGKCSSSFRLFRSSFDQVGDVNYCGYLLTKPRIGRCIEEDLERLPIDVFNACLNVRQNTGWGCGLLRRAARTCGGLDDWTGPAVGGIYCPSLLEDLSTTEPPKPESFIF